MITSKVVIDNITYKGDLARNIYKLDSLHFRPSYIPDYKVNLKKQHIKIKDWDVNQSIDVLTIGDSFSNADTQGINPFYQDYIATYNNLNVLNIPRHVNYRDNFFETILSMLNNKLLDDIRPKYMIIESVERLAIDRFSNKFNFNVTIQKTTMLNDFKKMPFKINANFLNNKNIFNNKNFKAFKNNLKFKFNKYGKYSGIYVAKLNQDFFTTKDKKSLLFINEDIIHIDKTTEDKIVQLNNNFNKLSQLLKKKNIKLYFMPVVDKYNLYSKFINNNPYPKSRFFELLRKLPKEYELIDTKKILRYELDRGSQDIYYADDTHWSYKASSIIFKKVNFD